MCIRDRNVIEPYHIRAFGVLCSFQLAIGVCLQTVELELCGLADSVSQILVISLSLYHFHQFRVCEKLLVVALVLSFSDKS